MNDIQTTGKLANPKLTLFAFHLRYNLTQGSPQPVENAESLWQKCVELGQKLNIPRLQSLPERLRNENAPTSQNNQTSAYLELLPQDKMLNFTAIPQKDKPHLAGEVYPLQIHDTYAVDLTLGYPHTTVEIAQLRGLNPDGFLLPSQIKASLGQTLMLFAQPVAEIEDERQLADACVEALLSDSEGQKLQVTCQAQGQFLGSPIFEYDNNQDNPERQCHILVWLNCHLQTEELEAASNYYQPLINLLCYRSKILYAYYQSRWCNNQARPLYSQWESKAKKFTELKSEPEIPLEQLKQWLTETPPIAFDYSVHLRDLELHRTTIETNAKNCRLSFDKIASLCVKGDNLDFWQNFLNLADDKFQEQILVDLSYLTPGQQLFEQMIATIRGVVAIAQAERERILAETIRQKDKAEQEQEQRLQLWIALVVTGLAVSSISSSVQSQPVETFLNYLYPHQTSVCPNAGFVLCHFYSFFDVIIHVAIGLGAALIARLIIKLWFSSSSSLS